MRYGKRITMAILFIIISFMLSGCVFGPGSSVDMDNPPSTAGIGSDMNNSSAVMSETETPGDLMNVTVYSYDEFGNVTPVTIEVPQEAGVAKATLSYMVKGGSGEAFLPNGFSGILPEGTVVREMDIKQDKLAVVDFSKEFLNYDAAAELDIVQAITWALTEFDSIDKVQLRVEGQDLDVMPVANTPVDRPLTRAMGINVETADNVNVSDTMPVTLYFEGANSIGDYSYYVPVTRLIPRTQDVAKATLEQLISGPKRGTKLFSSILPDTQLIEVAITGDTVMANFSKELLSFDGTSKVSEEVIQSIVLSLTENTMTKNVQVLVEGDSRVMAGEQSLEKPVNRPVKINKTEF